MSSEPRVAVVTGGTRGIGRGIVLELALRGFRVVANYRSDSRSAEETVVAAREFSRTEVEAIMADVSDPERARGLLEEVLRRHGRVDVWVNNAGIAPERRADLLDLSVESWDRVLGTNLKGPFFLTQLVAKSMLEQLAAGVIFSPRIIFITSISSEFATTTRGEYCISKAGLSMAVKLFAARLAEHGILVNEVRPGIIDTDMTSAVRDAYTARIEAGLTPIRRWGTAEDVGKAVGAIADGAFPFSTGDVFHIDGGLNLSRL